MIKGVIRLALLFCTLILSMMMLYSSVYKFVDPMWSNQFAVWGYSDLFMYVVASIEMIIALLIFIKQTRIPALIALIVLLCGAIYTHVANQDPYESVTAIFLIGLSIATIGFQWFDKKFETK